MNAIELLMTQHLETRQIFHALKELERNAVLETAEHPSSPKAMTESGEHGRPSEGATESAPKGSLDKLEDRLGAAFVAGLGAMQRVARGKTGGGEREEQEAPRGASRFELTRDLARNLLAHAVIEREIFYPAVGEALGDDKMLREAFEEHDLVEFELRKLLGALTEEDDADFAAKLDVLCELVEHHVREEEFELLGRAELALGKERLSELGEQMKARFEEAHARDVEALLADLAGSAVPVLGSERAA